MALVTCPTSSIGTRSKHDVRTAARAFPESFTSPDAETMRATVLRVAA